MQLIRGLHNITPRHRGCIVTIGNFDGVHLGHQKVVRDVVEEATSHNLRSTVVIFEPQPAEFFAPQARYTRLTDLREKIRVFQACGVDQVLCLRFDRHMAQKEAEEFVTTLVTGLRARHLVVGHDFRFGKNRRGDIVLLREYAESLGYSLRVVQPHLEDSLRVSSTEIRQRLAEGNLAEAAKLLGRPYAISGLVLHGDKRGRLLGFPTANLRPKHQNTCLHGVYAVTVEVCGRKPLRGVANLGTRPTVEGTRLQLEVHILDFSDDLYRKHLRVNLLTLLRDERKFDSLEQLQQQIERDTQAAREFFNQFFKDHHGQSVKIQPG